MSTVNAVLVSADVVVILANVYLFVLNRRIRAQIERQLRAREFAATEPARRYEGPA